MAKRNQKAVVRDGDQLGARLNDYSAVTSISAAAKSVRSRVGNWPIYAAAAGSALAMSTNASASLIYCGASDNYCESVVQHPVLTATANELQGLIPLVQSTVNHVPDSHQILLSVNQGTIGGFGVFQARALGVGVRIFDIPAASTFAGSLKKGASIGPNQGASTVLRSHGILNAVFTTGYALGNFKPAVTGIAGFAITGVGIGSKASQHNQTDYGWIRLVFNVNQAGDPVTLTAIDWAYQTDGSAVGAGEVPEPGTMGLTLLALGAVGIAALKRRRKPVPATLPAL